MVPNPPAITTRNKRKAVLWVLRETAERSIWLLARLFDTRQGPLPARLSAAAALLFGIVPFTALLLLKAHVPGLRDLYLWAFVAIFTLGVVAAVWFFLAVELRMAVTAEDSALRLELKQLRARLEPALELSLEERPVFEYLSEDDIRAGKEASHFWRVRVRNKTPSPIQGCYAVLERVRIVLPDGSLRNPEYYYPKWPHDFLPLPSGRDSFGHGAFNIDLPGHEEAYFDYASTRPNIGIVYVPSKSNGERPQWDRYQLPCPNLEFVVGVGTTGSPSTKSHVRFTFNVGAWPTVTAAEEWDG